MKEASGELSMTAITVVAIAAIAGVFTTLIYPQIKKNIEIQTKCASKFNCNANCENGMQSCYVLTEGGTSEPISCPCSK